LVWAWAEPAANKTIPARRDLLVLRAKRFMGTGLRRMEWGRELVRFGVPNHKRRIVSKYVAQRTG
jgi:hypothetical protein